ncbi:tRNA (adenine-N1)-methyltransferase [Serinibacter salmoneus]|uniref:tRNA (adenine-N1)-methyltransferase n=1 Tax=Serinibacter salmoneus TaxID=556530 RepID=UPI001FE58A39|nr:tRNA (adenine-N1)-methyltransferase [Serinibacter salmoneus]
MGADLRRGPLRYGDRVQLTDPRGKPTTILLSPDGSFQTHRGYFRHSELVGRPEGTVIETTHGVAYLALRPLLSDHVLSMPRGATPIYPKDSAQIISVADVFPGAVVFEAGVGSGALTMSLLRAVGETGRVISAERREDFAAIARENVGALFGTEHPAWELRVGDAQDVLLAQEPGSVDRIVLDMLAPWENIDAVAHALAPGGVLVAYVATTTQLSRVAEDLKEDGRFTEPVGSETMVREWHTEGLAVRPEHRMVGHTGFLLAARRMAPGFEAPIRRRRPARSLTTMDADEQEALARDAARVQIQDDWDGEGVERDVTAKKARKAAKVAGAMNRGAQASLASTDYAEDTADRSSDDAG